MSNQIWVIARKPPGTVPEVGKVYEVRDSRKGTYTVEITAINGEWATGNVLMGEIHWASKENRLFNSNPETTTLRAPLVYLIETEQAEEA